MSTLRQTQLNKTTPTAAKVKLGDVLADLISQVNILNAAVRAITTKLDADAGVTDTNYTATVAPAANTIVGLETRT